MITIANNHFTRSNPKVRIAYSGRKLGNLDSKYDISNESRLNRKKFLDACSKHGQKTASLILAQGKNYFVTTTNRTYGTYKVDGLITRYSGEALLLAPADCVPLVFYNQRQSILALAHVGLIGAQLELHKLVVNHLLKEYDLAPAELWAYIGPSIKKRSYIYSYLAPSVASDKKLMQFITTSQAGFNIDLSGLLRSDLTKLGLQNQYICESHIDTFSSNNYFSHRRAKKYNQPDGRNGFAVWMVN